MVTVGKTTVDSDSFAEFLKQNMETIKKITPKNPTIKKDDEWVKETFMTKPML